MADKKKLDTAALKPEAVSSEDEVVNIDLGDGEITTLYRGAGSKRMDDAQWARLKQRAMPVESAKKEISGGQLMQIARGESSVARSVISEDEQKALDGMSEGSRYEFLRQRFKHKGYAVPDAAAPAAKASGADSVNLAPPPSKASAYEGPEKRAADQAEAIPSFEDRERIRKMGDKADKLRIKQLDKEAGDLKDLQVTGAMGSADPGMSVRGQMARLATGAIDPNGKNPITGNSDVHLKRAIDKGNATGEADLQAISDLNDNLGKTKMDMLTEIPRQIDQRVFGNEPLIPDVVKQIPQAAGAQAAILGGNIAGGVGSALGMPNLEQAGNNLAAGAVLPPAYGGPAQPTPPEGVTSPDQAPAPTKMPPLDSNLSGSGSASMSVKIPSGFKVESVDPELVKQYDADRLAQKGRISDAMDTLAAGEIVKDGLVRAAAEREKTVQADAAKMAQLATQARLDSIEEARGYQTRKLALAKQAQEAAATPIDPNRFWNNKDAGQKAAAVIAGALFGFTGQGMQWLQRLDGLVNADNQLQAQDRASKVAGLQQEAETLGEAGRQAMAQGASRAEAFLIDRNTKLEGLKSFLDMTTMKTNNMDAKMRGAQMSMQLQDMIVKNDQEALQLGQQRADKKTEWNYRNAELGQSAAIATAKIQAGGEGGDKLNPQAQTTIAQAEAGLGMIPELERAIGNPGGKISTALYDQITKLFPGTDANNRDIQAAFLNRTIFAGIDRSVINAADQTFLDKLQASPGLSSLRAPGAIAALKRMLTLSRNAAIQTARSVGQRTGDLQLSPDTGAASPINFTPTR